MDIYRDGSRGTREKETGEITYYIIKPDVFWVGLTTFVATVAKNSLYLVLFLILLYRPCVVPCIRFFFFVKLLEILNVIEVVGYLASPTGDAKFVRLRPRPFFFLGTRSIVRIRV